MAWSSSVMSGKEVEIFEPENTVRGVMVFLHGYDGVTLRNNLAYTSLLNAHGLACLCPIGPGCWWSDQVYPPFDPSVSPVQFLWQSLPDFCQARWNLPTSKIGITGVEMGGQGALQLVYRYARQLAVVVAISPKVDFESWYGHGTTLDEMFASREATRQAIATLHIHPLNWPKHQLLLCDPADIYCFDGVQTLVSKLTSTGIPFDSDFVSTHGGFGWGYADAMAPRVIEYIARHLE